MDSRYKFFPDPNTGYLSDEDTKKYFSRLGLAVFAMGVAASLVSTALTYLVLYLAGAFAPHLLESKIFVGLADHLVSMIPLYCVGLPIFLVLTRPLPKIQPLKAKMRFSRWVGGFCIAELAMITGNYISNFILLFFQSAFEITPENPIAEITSQSEIWVTVIFMCILAPILEELVFRRVVCDRLLPLGEGYAIFVSAAIFGLFHQNFYQFAYAFLMGALFALIYVKTGKIIYSTVYHILINLLGSVVAPYILEQIDLDKINEMLETGVYEFDAQMLTSLYLLAAYEVLIMAAAIVGIVLFVKAIRKREIALEEGILPPPKKHRVANIFCTVGVAAAITYFVFTFVLSLL